jgi:hypothetical protein
VTPGCVSTNLSIDASSANNLSGPRSIGGKRSGGETEGEHQDGQQCKNPFHFYKTSSLHILRK